MKDDSNADNRNKKYLEEAKSFAKEANFSDMMGSLLNYAKSQKPEMDIQNFPGPNNPPVVNDILNLYIDSYKTKRVTPALKGLLSKLENNEKYLELQNHLGEVVDTLVEYNHILSVEHSAENNN